MLLSGCGQPDYTFEPQQIDRDEYDITPEAAFLFLDCDEETLDGIFESDYEQPGYVCTGSCYL